MRHIATEGRCFVISVNQFATKADYPSDYPAFKGVLCLLFHPRLVSGIDYDPVM